MSLPKRLIPCPLCSDQPRAARRECVYCGRTGLVPTWLVPTFTADDTQPDNENGQTP